MSFALGSLGSDSQGCDLNLTFPVITAITLTVGAVAWRYCFGSKQTVVPAKSALQAIPVDEKNSEAVRVEKTVRFTDSTKSESDSSQPGLNEKDCSVSDSLRFSNSLRFSKIVIQGLNSLSEQAKVYPEDLVSVLSRFIDPKEDKEQHIAQVMFRRAERPLCKPSRGALPEWFYTNQPSSSEQDRSVIPYIKGSDVQSFVRDFLSAKSYASHSDCSL